MANEVGTTLLNSITGSTFNIGNMAKVMAEADVAGPRAIIERKQDKVTTELDALKYLQSNLEAFNTYVSDMTSTSLFAQKSATSTNDNVVSVTATTDAALAAYQIESKQLAQAHTMVANKVFNSPADVLATGNLDITVGGQVHSIPVDSSNNTLEGLQKVINNGDYGVTASIINNGSGYQLMFTSKQSGSSGQMSISGLTDLNGAADFTTTSAAQDALMVVNGVSVTSSSNTFDNVIDGVSFQLHSATPGTVQQVNVGQNTENVYETISSFVDVYNQLGTIFKELGSYDQNKLTQEEKDSEEFQYFGDLAGSSLLRSVRDQVKSSLSGAIAELSGSGFRALADIGITIDREGVMQLDSSKLDAVINGDIGALSNLLAKTGSSDDPLINVIGGNDRTQTGSYDLQISQLAERASVTADSAVLFSERVNGDAITDANLSLTIDPTAVFDLTVGGVTQNINLAAISGASPYATQDDVATAIQAQIDAAFGFGQATIGYFADTNRFEISSTAGGTVSMANVVGMSNQGFSAASYAGEQFIDLSAGGSFSVKVDDSVTSTVNISGRFDSADAFSRTMSDYINNNTEVKSAGASVSVTFDGTSFSVASDRYGAFSTVELTGFSGLANAGFNVDATDVGQNVDGTITTASGTLNIGAYASQDDGRRVVISDYAVIAGNAAEVRGLEFEVLGGAADAVADPLGVARGSITFSQGFASRLAETIGNLFDADTGLISQRIDSLSNKLEGFTERTTKLDERYDKLLYKYQLQFATLQSLLSSSQQTRDYLSATFSNNNSN